MGRSEPCLQKTFPRDQSEGYLPYTKCSVDEITEEDFQIVMGIRTTSRSHGLS